MNKPKITAPISLIEKYPMAAALAVVLASCVLGVLLGLLAFHLVNP